MRSGEVSKIVMDDRRHKLYKAVANGLGFRNELHVTDMTNEKTLIATIRRKHVLRGNVLLRPTAEAQDDVVGLDVKKVSKHRMEYTIHQEHSQRESAMVKTVMDAIYRDKGFRYANVQPGANVPLILCLILAASDAFTIDS